jgi:hypothetical protein
MGTKNNPGKFDCYEAAHPDEPMFVLLGRDPLAPHLVRLWALLRSGKLEEADKAVFFLLLTARPYTSEPDTEKAAEAMECVAAMERWLITSGKLFGPGVVKVDTIDGMPVDEWEKKHAAHKR